MVKIKCTENLYILPSTALLFSLDLIQVDPTTGRMTGNYKTYAICGAIRRMVCVIIVLLSES